MKTKQLVFNTKSLDLAALEELRGCLVQEFRAVNKGDGSWDVVITGYKSETFFMEVPSPLTVPFGETFENDGKSK